MKIAFVLYPDFTALDLVGPYEVISHWPDADVRFLATTTEPVRCDRGLTVLPTDTPQTLTDPDMIVVPGSEKPLGLLEDQLLIDWLRVAAPGCEWTASVCTGAGLYAAAGLLDGKKTTTHWAFRDNLRAMGVDVVGDRFVFQGNPGVARRQAVRDGPAHERPDGQGTARACAAGARAACRSPARRRVRSADEGHAATRRGAATTAPTRSTGRGTGCGRPGAGAGGVRRHGQARRAGGAEDQVPHGLLRAHVRQASPVAIDVATTTGSGAT